MTRRAWDSVSRRPWARARAAQLKREPWCRLCREERDRLVEATEVDHIVPISQGGAKFAASNLRSLCDGCHIERHGGRRRVEIDPATGLPLPGERHPWNEE
jgi:5-methylcytosine-specific restriction endonuclease McrA